VASLLHRLRVLGLERSRRLLATLGHDRRLAGCVSLLFAVWRFAPSGPGIYNGAYICASGLWTIDAVVLYQPKGTIDPANVLKFRPLFEEGADLVIASRIGNGARNEKRRMHIATFPVEERSRIGGDTHSSCPRS
jgi:hypothetical protein